MSTFEIKLMVLNSLGSAWTPELAEQAYDWIMSEVEIESTDQPSATVTTLTPVN